MVDEGKTRICENVCMVEPKYGGSSVLQTVEKNADLDIRKDGESGDPGLRA